MANPSKTKINRPLFISALILILGIVFFFIGQKNYVPTDFWSIYKIALRGTGLMMIIFGLIWTFLYILKKQTSFFDFSTRMQSDKFLFSLIVILITITVMILLTKTYLPRKSLQDLPKGANERAIVQKKELNFHILIIGVVLCCGAGAFSIPCRRFFMR